MCVHTPMPLDHLAAKLGQTGKLLFTRVGRELIRPIWGFSNRFFKKPVIPDLTREFPDLTRAARVKTKAWRPKLKGMQTIQLLTTPREAACKTSNLTPITPQKTPCSQNTAKASTAGTADTEAPRGRVRGKAAHPTGATPGPAPALVRRRPRQTSRRANGQAHRGAERAAY